VASAAAPAAQRATRVIDEAIHVIPAEWFKPSPLIYWTDMLLSASVGWTMFALAVSARGWGRVLLLIVATGALYRAVLFIHEITHLARHELPGFRIAWNTLVGVPLLLPSFLYENVHTDHHRQRCYGTESDPEYLPFGRRSPLLLIGCTGASLFLPFALVVRFGVLAPMSWLVRSWRQSVLDRASALVINHRYVRRTPIGRAGHVHEAAACVMVWTAAGAWWSGALPTSAIACWLSIGAAASGINAMRTLAAHRYGHDDGEVSMTEQLLDSCTIAPDATTRLARLAADAGRAVIVPVGLRYHALHHWIPSLPYHRLGRAHRLLVARLRPEGPYAATIEPTVSTAIRDLIRRSRMASRR
jgi:fatty acid desaturase